MITIKPTNRREDIEAGDFVITFCKDDHEAHVDIHLHVIDKVIDVEGERTRLLGRHIWTYGTGADKKLLWSQSSYETGELRWDDPLAILQCPDSTDVDLRRMVKIADDIRHQYESAEKAFFNQFRDGTRAELEAMGNNINRVPL